MEKYDSIDANGNDLRLGDWVKVIAAPTTISNMPKDSKESFSRAIGETLQIEAFNDIGCIELDFYPKLRSFDTTWLEPFLCVRFRRYKKFSKRFQQKLQLSREFEVKDGT
ncbi:MAG: hypothetical protein V3U88_02320 [Methylococcales bacterium]